MLSSLPSLYRGPSGGSGGGGGVCHIQLTCITVPSELLIQ